MTYMRVILFAFINLAFKQDHYTLALFNLLVIIPVEVIRLLDAVRRLLGKDAVPFAAVWSQPGVVCSEKVMFNPLTC